MCQPVVSARPDMTLHEAASLMHAHGINGLPVLDAELRVVGVVGIKDILRAPFRSGDEVYISSITPLARLAGRLPRLHVDDVMARPPVCVRPDEPLSAVMAFMINRGIHPIPVTDTDQRLLGVIGRADVLGVLLARHGAPGGEFQRLGAPDGIGL